MSVMSVFCREHYTRIQQLFSLDTEVLGLTEKQSVVQSVENGLCNVWNTFIRSSSQNTQVTSYHQFNRIEIQDEIYSLHPEIMSCTVIGVWSCTFKEDVQQQKNIYSLPICPLRCIIKGIN